MIRPLLFLGAARVASGQMQTQMPFNAHFPQHEQDTYEFQWPVKNVAIIGAGVGGLMAFRTFTETGSFDSIRVFERDNMPGGNWHYTEETPVSTSVHNQTSDWWTGDYDPTHPPLVPSNITHRVGKDGSPSKETLEWERLVHRSPTPVWASLEANTPSPQQQIPGFSWPDKTPWATNQPEVQKYLRSFASWLGINYGDNNPSISYNTRVESVTKRFNSITGEHHGWRLLLRKFVKTNEGTYEESWWEEHFDAVVVATGRFNVPYIPPIPGLEDWQKRFPERVQHARQYRRPEPYEGRNVIVVGAGPSATEVSRDVNKVVNASYLSVRTSKDTRIPRSFFLSRVPSNTTVVGEIKSFRPITLNQGIRDGVIELVNGTLLTGIDTIIMGTGYRYGFPFLSQYHNSSVVGDDIPDVPEQPLVTDGTHVRSLFYDVFYIDQPTIGFLNLNTGMQAFTYGRYTSTVLAKVWSGHASLPSKKRQWDHFWSSVESRGGLNKRFQWLSEGATTYNERHFIGWLNAAAIHHGGSLVETPPDSSEVMKFWVRARYGADLPGSVNASMAWADPRSPLFDTAIEQSYLKALLDDW
ncbi:FAD/NAD(P)-binding domain-containing protein [Flagelloscypha sp. PMI_526]|nr:FAD/NAD(P)-binding domain-containing protein [Flagelloscypha sp. PMI_526]